MLSISEKHTNIILLGFLLAGCNSQPVKYYTKDNSLRDKVTSSNIVILSEGDEVQARVESSNLSTYLLGGLVPVLLDSLIETSRQGRADDLTKTASENIADFSISEQIKTALEENSDPYAWLKVTGVERYEGKGSKTDVIKKLYGAGDEDLLIVVQPVTYFLPDFEGLMIKLTITVYPRAGHLREYKMNAEADISEMSGHVEFHYHELPAVSKNKKVNLEKWAENSGEEIKKAIHEGTAELSAGLVSYLSKPFPILDSTR